MKDLSRRVAIIDMYNGVPNKGMAGIKKIIDTLEYPMSYDLFDARGDAELPNLDDYSIFISTGGPGNPLEEGSVWQQRYFDFLELIVAHNNVEENDKKHVFLICHSFQMACHHFGLGTISKRKSRSFGIYHVELESAVMAIRFTKEIIGTQFHPEADQNTFFEILQNKMVREETIELRGKQKYYRMLDDLLDEEKIAKTYNTVLPNFLRHAYREIVGESNKLIYAAEV